MGNIFEQPNYLTLGSSTPLEITRNSFIISNNNFSGDSAGSTGPAFIINGNGNSIQGNNWTNFDDSGIVNANGNIIIGNMIAGTGPIVDSRLNNIIEYNIT